MRERGGRIRGGWWPGRALLAALVLVGPAEGASLVQLGGPGRMAVALSHVSAVRFVAADGKAEVRLLFSADPPTGVVLADPFGDDTVHGWAAGGPHAAALLAFDEASPEQYRFRVYRDGEVLSGGGTRMSGDLRGVIRSLEVRDGAVAGVVEIDEPAALAGRFDAPLRTVRAVAPVRGPAVAASPQVQALLAFARAMSGKDFAAAQRHAVRDVAGQMEATRRELGDAFVDEMLKDLDPGRLQAQIQSPDAELLEAGDAARIRLVERTADGSGTSTRTFRLTRVGGAWKVN